MKYLVLIAYLIIAFVLTPFEAKPNDDVHKNLKVAYKAFMVSSGCDFYITSARRSIEVNKRVNGAANSFHLHGKAYDLVPKVGCLYNYKELAYIAKKHFTGVIVYKEHIHVDIGDREYFRDKE